MVKKIKFGKTLQKQPFVPVKGFPHILRARELKDMATPFNYKNTTYMQGANKMARFSRKTLKALKKMHPVLVGGNALAIFNAKKGVFTIVNPADPW